MNNNLELYNEVRVVPDEAKKPIIGGRLKGFTDINPMWRIKTLTEQFGVCGFGWKIEIVKMWLEPYSNGEITANVEIKLFVKIGEQWSEPIVGIGGSMYAEKQKSGIFIDDECYKKAYTDACSVACKNLGIGADVYFEKDSASKYSKSENDGITSQQVATKGKDDGNKGQTLSKFKQITELIKDSDLTMESVKEWVVKKFKNDIKINDLTDEQFGLLVKAITKFIEEQPNE